MPREATRRFTRHDAAKRTPLRIAPRTISVVTAFLDDLALVIRHAFHRTEVIRMQRVCARCIASTRHHRYQSLGRGHVIPKFFRRTGRHLLEQIADVQRFARWRRFPNSLFVPVIPKRRRVRPLLDGARQIEGRVGYRYPGRPRDLIANGIISKLPAWYIRHRMRMLRIQIRICAHVRLVDDIAIGRISIRRHARGKRILHSTKIGTCQAIERIMLESLRLVLLLSHILAALQVEPFVPPIRQLLDRRSAQHRRDALQRLFILVITARRRHAITKRFFGITTRSIHLVQLPICVLCGRITYGNNKPVGIAVVRHLEWRLTQRLRISLRFQTTDVVVRRAHCKRIVAHGQQQAFGLALGRVGKRLHRVGTRQRVQLANAVRRCIPRPCRRQGFSRIEL